MLFRLLLFMLLLTDSAIAAELGIVGGRSTESGETDVGRLIYRTDLAASQWWAPRQVQYGLGIWRVPDIRGATQRVDLSATAIWRKERAWGYFEAGFGGYLLSKTVNSPQHRLPSAFEFGSHLGAGVRLGRTGRLGVAIQHLSNAGLKQPNGGIDLVLIQYTVSTGTPNR
jgi:hypothetical protein